MPLVLSEIAEEDDADNASVAQLRRREHVNQVEDRIRALELSLREECRALREAKERYRSLEFEYQELAQRP